MSYSIKPILHTESDRFGLYKIRIQVIYNRMKVYATTDYKVNKNQFSGEVTAHPHKATINANLRKQITDIEQLLIVALRDGALTKDVLKHVIKNEIPIVNTSFLQFMERLQHDYKGKLSPGVLRHYKVMQGKILDYDKAFTFARLSVTWLIGLEAHIRKEVGINTVNSNMRQIKAIFNKAYAAGLVTHEQFEKYKVPRYIQPVIEWLTEDEIVTLHEFIEKVGKPGHKLAGYYFLLSCYTGYRISDAKRFDAMRMIKEGNIILRAKKNNTLVSIPVYPRLQKVIDYIHNKPLYLSEEKVREYIKEMAAMAGIKKHVKFHTSRHSFAMMLMAKGFSQEEVAELLGDTVNIARIYARISNKQLADKVRARL